MKHYYEAYKITHSEDWDGNDIDYKGSCEAIAFDTLEEAIEYADKNYIEKISEIGGNWADYEKCWFCEEWFESTELNEKGTCCRCDIAIKDHNGGF